MCSLGVYYGQCMQNMLETVVDQTDAILTIDSDSIFTSQHIETLLSRAMSYANVDALCSMQARRGIAYPLFTVGAVENCELQMTSEPMQIVTGHFGLTVIKSAALLKTPKPWFFGQPGEGGTWAKGQGRIDDDIWFWKQFAAGGNVAAVDPMVRIGHMEEMVTYYDSSMKLKTAYPADLADELRIDFDVSETAQALEAAASGICVHGDAAECCQGANS